MVSKRDPVLAGAIPGMRMIRKMNFLGRRNLLKLGTMCCHADIINYGALPYTDFIRTKTLCHGGEYCDFRFVRHDSDAGEGWIRFKSI